MSALDVLRQIKQLRRQQQTNVKIVEWGNADYINNIGIENLTRKELRNHLEARDLETAGTRLELLERLRTSLADEQLHKFAYNETIDTDVLIQADMEERGSVYVTGLNDRGQLGLGDMEPRKFFTCVPNLKGLGVCFVASGADMSYAITQEHDVYVWGGGGVGRTGINPNIRKRGNAAKEQNWLEPIPVTDLQGEECSAVTVGASHCLALGRGGDCFVWGDNDAGQLGLGDFTNKVSVCINNSFPPVAQVCTGSNHSAALTRSGKVYTWGHGSYGRLGIGETERIGSDEKLKYFFPVPNLLSTLEPITQISCGADHMLAKGNSGVWTWGNGSGGKLGIGDTTNRNDPVLIPKLRGKSVLQVLAGTWHSMAIVQYPPMLQGGYLYTWGSGFHGQLAQGTKTVCLEPTIVEYFTHIHTLIKMVAAGSHHCMAVTKDGEVYSWGSNNYGELGRYIITLILNYTNILTHRLLLLFLDE